MQKVQTRYGELEGIARQGVTEFRGVPFARPPLGEWRFRGPRPPQPWRGTFQAQTFAPAAVQELNPLMGVEQTSEDCLYLNLWVPEGEGPFPVMVWFHGGGYVSGSPSQLLYQGEALAREQGVIVVNAAYRLGALGYGWYAPLAPELEAEGNLGLRDQVAALQWVRENIGDFGGDADRVTIFGESAGGFSVATLLAVPSARDLFHRAIVQSGAGDYVLAPEEATRVAEAVLEALPGNGPAADRLLAADQKDWVRAQRQGFRQLVKRGLRDTTPQFAMTFLPVVDGDFLPRMPVDAIAAGCAKDTPVMAGVCRDEWNLFQYAPPFNGGVGLDRLRQLDDDEIRHRFRRALPYHGDEAMALYRERITPDPRRATLDLFCAVESDRLFRVPTQRLLDAQTAAGGSARGFQFTWEIEAFGVPLGACHVVDVPFVFGLVDTPVGQLFTGGGAQAQALSGRVRDVWGAFARGEEPDWPEWHVERTLECFGRERQRLPLHDEGLESFWREVIADPAAQRA